MKILITVEFYYGRGGGGIDKQARQIAEGLASRGYDITVATSFDASRPLLINKVKIIGFRVFGNLVKGYKGEVNLYQKFIIKSDFDVIINFAANIWTTDIVFENVDCIKAKKILSTPGLSKIDNPIYKNYYENIYFPSLRKYNRVIYTSSNYRDKIFGDKHGLQDRAVIIPNGAGEEFLSAKSGFRKRYNIQTRYLVLTVANHYFAKGHSFVINAFKYMKRSDATLAIIGDLPGRNFWYSCWPFCLAKSFWNHNVVILKKISRDLVLSAYKEADIFLFGSRIETAPLVMYESFASKTPFITTKAGNVADYLDYLRIIETPREAADVANRFLDNQEEREELARKSFNLWLNNYTWDAIVKQYDNLIKSIVK